MSDSYVDSRCLRYIPNTQPALETHPADQLPRRSTIRTMEQPKLLERKLVFFIGTF